MVFEVSNELDCRRVGVDKYSLCTRLRIRSIMVISTRVLKEPRGFIRIIQCILAILAFSTTAGFSTTFSFKHTCDPENSPIINFTFGYPFDVSGREILVAPCEDEGHDVAPYICPYDFSGSAEFFVATGVLSFLYTIIALVFYIFMHQEYANDPKLPVIDLAISAILSIFWLAGSSAWAQGVTDIKYYLHPGPTLFGQIQNCYKDACETVEDSSYTPLNVSLVFGFACFLLWTSGLWFVYKETVFHTPTQPEPDPMQNQTSKGDGRV